MLTLASNLMVGLVLEIANLSPASPACQDKVQFEQQADGSVTAIFSQLNVERGAAKPFVKCRIAGAVLVPKGLALEPQPILARVSGFLDQPGDLVGGRVSLRLMNQTARDLRAVKHGEASGPVSVDLKAELPQLSACDADKRLNLSVLLEAAINYRLDAISAVNARLENLTIPALTLRAASCPESPPNQGKFHD